jgi:hypothetical protein
VKLLLAHGANKDAKDNEKMSPLALTRQLQPNYFEEIIQILEQ